MSYKECNYSITGDMVLIQVVPDVINIICLEMMSLGISWVFLYKLLKYNNLHKYMTSELIFSTFLLFFLFLLFTFIKVMYIIYLEQRTYKQ